MHPPPFPSTIAGTVVQHVFCLSTHDKETIHTFGVMQGEGIPPLRANLVITWNEKNWMVKGFREVCKEMEAAEGDVLAFGGKVNRGRVQVNLLAEKGRVSGPLCV